MSHLNAAAAARIAANGPERAANLTKALQGTREGDLFLSEVFAHSPDTALQDPWTLFTLDDAYQDRAPVEYIVEGLIPAASVSTVYGSPGTLKPSC